MKSDSTYADYILAVPLFCNIFVYVIIIVLYIFDAVLVILQFKVEVGNSFETHIIAVVIIE